ncbi:MAG: asparagine synthase (glutamine-hydrolyzing) [Planctomycetes bacterium]|nr:asparagine synthase (glutamine-hydrolyzing) [Planctomycetota bacterium]
MCGIVGYIDPEGGAAIDLEAMLGAVAHRGPDESRLLRQGTVGLGSARLALVGGPQGAQPRRSERGSLLALNGEIYNWRDLGDDEGEGEGESDTATLHDLLDREGPEILAQLRGGFALAWAPKPGRLLLARDPFGQRPLYWARLGRALIFASEIRALHAAGLARGVDQAALASLLRWQFLAPGRSLHAGVTALAPGEILDLRLKGESLSFRRRRIDLAELALGAGEDEIGDLLHESAWLQGRGEVATGILLSGGLDSTATLALLDREGRRPDRAFLGWFPEGPAEIDERPFARLAAETFGLPLVELPIHAADFAAALPRTIAALEEPLAGPGAVSQLLLCERAAAEVRVLFGGQGGDELFGGYERLRILAALEAGLEADFHPAYAPLATRMLAARERSPGDSLAAYRAAVDRGSALAELGNDRARELLGGAPDLRDLLPEAPAGATAFAAAFEWQVLLPGLLQVDDRCCAAFGIEGRSIFLDQALAAELLAMPLARRSPAGSPRALFHRLLDPILPPAIAARREKLGFPLPLASWWRGPLRELARDELGTAATAGRGLVDAKGLDRLLEDDGQGGRLIYFLLMLELWFRRLEAGRAGGAMEDQVR